MRRVALKEVAPAEQAEGEVSGEVWELSLGEIESDTGRLTERVWTRADELGPSKITFDERNVLYSRMRPYLNKVLLPDAFGIGSSELVPLRPDPEQIDRRYLAHYLRSPEFVSFANSNTSGANLPRMSMRAFWKHEIPLPPLDQQRHISAILDRADALRAKRQRAQAMLDDLLCSVFVEIFGDPVLNPKGWPTAKLSKVAKVASGVTKGKKIGDRSTVTLPYMRVANVQDGHIDLSEIKEIEVTVEDAQRYALLEGDILLTEGGDPDKLGRGAVWHSEIDPCIHQNHIFRVRTDTSKLLPEFASAVIGSERGKRYFLGAAKQTTGIASINKTQLSAFPMLLTPVDLQQRYVTLVENVSQVQERLTNRDHVLDDLYHALAQRAFRGELTEPAMAV